MATTADWLIYAIGGGHGHARRGWLLQRLLARSGQTALLLIRPGSDRYLPEGKLPRIYAESLADPDLAPLTGRPSAGIVVDTFPRGWREELNEDLLGRYETRLWLARHSNNHGAADATPYHRVLSPYPAECCEWDGQLPMARHCGYVVDAGHLDFKPDRRHFVLVDSEHRCNSRLLELLRAAARKAGLEFHSHRHLHTPIRAAKLLVVGAGYHSFYECLGQDTDVRFLPIRKRHDDQFRRAKRYDRSLNSLDDLMPWLAAPPVAQAIPARLDGNAVLTTLNVYR
ncbi:MAG: hypothetical protein FIA97_15375 [Methylococcaceae bacterium]|nr:hypothetical protein [Methylococcaceae bacterium]